MYINFSFLKIVVVSLTAITFDISSEEAPMIVAFSAHDQDGPQYSNQREIGRDTGAAGLNRASNIELAFEAGDQKVSAVQFLISSDIDLSEADLSNCAGMLPDTHMGDCKVKGENILFYAFSPVNAPLPDGVLGSISVNAGRNIEIETSGWVMADINGVELNID